MSDMVLLAVAMLAGVGLWELLARRFDTPLLPLGPAELAVRLGPAESIAARLAAPPLSERPSPLPPPPAERLAPAHAASPQHPQLLFQKQCASELEQQLAGADWVLGWMSGRSWHGGLLCKDRNV